MQACPTFLGQRGGVQQPLTMQQVEWAVAHPALLARDLTFAWTASVRRCSPGEWQGPALVGGQPSNGKGCGAAGGQAGRREVGMMRQTKLFGCPPALCIIASGASHLGERQAAGGHSILQLLLQLGINHLHQQLALRWGSAWGCDGQELILEQSSRGDLNLSWEEQGPGRQGYRVDRTGWGSGRTAS